MGDSIGKDIGANSDLDRRVHPHYGIKKNNLRQDSNNQFNPNDAKYGIIYDK